MEPQKIWFGRLAESPCIRSNAIADSARRETRNDAQKKVILIIIKSVSEVANSEATFGSPELTDTKKVLLSGYLCLRHLHLHLHLTQSQVL